MAFALPNFTDSAGLGLYQLMLYANTVTADWFFVLISIALFCIAFLALMGNRYPTPRAFAGASFIYFISSTLLWAIGLLTWKGAMLSIFAVFGGIIALKTSGSKDI